MGAPIPRGSLAPLGIQPKMLQQRKSLSRHFPCVLHPPPHISLFCRHRRSEHPSGNITVYNEATALRSQIRKWKLLLGFKLLELTQPLLMKI